MGGFGGLGVCECDNKLLSSFVELGGIRVRYGGVGVGVRRLLRKTVTGLSNGGFYFGEL